MSRAERAILERYEKAIRKLKTEQSTQSFDGTVRVDPNRVFVGRKDGLRALEVLKKLKVAVEQN